MIDYKRTAEYFMKNSVYAFTTDIDFAPEWAIRETLKVFRDLEIPLTPFITHKSKAIKEYYGAPEKRRYVGIHPWINSTYQGECFNEVVRNLLQIWPEARTLRVHGYKTKSKLDRAFTRMGAKYESNICLCLQPYCTPLRHCSGTARFPVWWEDDVHMRLKSPLKLNTILEQLEIPGMKIINFHPILFTLNAIKEEGNVLYYDSITKLWMRTRVPMIEDERKWRDHIYKGSGVQQFIKELIEYIKSNNHKVMYLDDLYESLKRM